MAPRLVEERYKSLHNRLGRHFAIEDDLIHEVEEERSTELLVEERIISKIVQTKQVKVKEALCLMFRIRVTQRHCSALFVKCTALSCLQFCTYGRI